LFGIENLSTHMYKQNRFLGGVLKFDVRECLLWELECWDNCAISSSYLEIYEGNEVGVCKKSMISTLGGEVKRSGASTSRNLPSMVKQSYF